MEDDNVDAESIELIITNFEFRVSQSQKLKQ
jgi:hypothetical protein